MAITDPRDISGLVAWYSAEAETGYADGANMTSWQDLSGNGNHATAAGTVSPTWKSTEGSAGGPAVRFPANTTSGGYFNLPDILSTASAGEIMATVKADSTATTVNGLWSFSGIASSNDGNYYPHSGLVYNSFGLPSGQRPSFTPTLSVTSWRRFNVWSAAADWTARLDEVTQSTYTGGTVVFRSGTPILGRTWAASAARECFKGWMGAVVIYNRKLTTTERAALAAWMAANPSGGTTGGAQTITVGQAAETDTAQPITCTPGPLAVAIGQASETDTAGTISALSNGSLIPLGQATETDTAGSIAPALGSLTVPIGRAAEADTAQTVTVMQPQTIPIGTAVEIDIARPVGSTGMFGVDTAEEIDAAQPIGVVQTYPHATVTADRANGRQRSGRGYLTVENPLDPGVSLTSRVDLVATAVSIEPPVFDPATGAPQAGWGDSRAVTQTVWADSLHLIIDGRDFTRFRDVAPEFVSWPALQEPFVYAGAVIRFPQIDFLEHRSTISAMPPGPLRRLRKHAKVKLVPALDGVRLDPIWRGEITKFGNASGTLQVQCDGEAVARLSQTQKQPILFHRRKDGGIFVFDAFREHNLRLKPRLGANTGIDLDDHGAGEPTLDYVSSVLADLVKLDGTQYTIGRTNDDRKYRMLVKDTTTVHYTIFAGTDGIDLSGLVRDVQEEPNTWYGSGQDPNGLLWFNGMYPNMRQGTPPPYPKAGGAPFGPGTTNADLTRPDDDDLGAMIWKLIGTPWLRRRDAGNGYDDEVAEAIEDLQAANHLPVTGVMNPATWDALYDLDMGRYSTQQARVLPVVQRDSVREWDRTSNGDLKRRNPDWNPKSRVVSRTLANGVMTKRRFAKWARGEMQRLNGPNWAGGITLTGVDVFQGDYHHGDPNPVVVSRMLVKPGQNVMVRGFDGDTLVHVAANNPDDARSTQLVVDTQARDVKTIGEIVARNKESRLNRGRVWRQANGPSGLVRDQRIPWSEIGGILDTPVHVAAGRWTGFWVVAGDEGQIGKIRLHIPGCEFAVAVFAQKVTNGWLNRHMPNPWGKDDDKHTNWMAPAVQERLYRQRLLLHAYGTDEEPAGYGDRLHTKADGSGPTDAPVTGVYENESGFPYRTGKQPLLWVAVKPRTAGVVRPGRILWVQQAEQQ